MIDTIIVNHKPIELRCPDGHTGHTVLKFLKEESDDRYSISVMSLCSDCHMMVAADQYANEENLKRFYAGLEPVSQ